MVHGCQMQLVVPQEMFLQMAKPDYATLLGQIAVETDPTVKQQLIDQCYVFTEALTDEEKDLFNYVSNDYFADNPSTTEFFLDDGVFKANSFIGVYFK